MIADHIFKRGSDILKALADAETRGQIRDGYINQFRHNLGLLSEDAQRVYAYRLSFCVTCPMKVGNACSKHQRNKRVDDDCYVNGCSCNLSTATKSPKKWCPMHKWPPVDKVTLAELPYPKDPPHNPCGPLKKK